MIGISIWTEKQSIMVNMKKELSVYDAEQWCRLDAERFVRENGDSGFLVFGRIYPGSTEKDLQENDDVVAAYVTEGDKEWQHRNPIRKYQISKK